MIDDPARARNVFDFEEVARARLDPDDYDYLAGGADGMRTMAANADAFTRVGIRARRLVDVSSVDTVVELLGERWPTPIALAPIGFQGMFDPGAEPAVARAAAGRHRMIVSTMSTRPIGEVAAAAGEPVWFQLYPTRSEATKRDLLARAEDAGCPVVVLTVDVPVIGNRERGGARLATMLGDGSQSVGNFENLTDALAIEAPALTWESVDRLRADCRMKIVLKGIVTAEDALLAVEHGVDGIVVSNHGGRQEESDRSTLECLGEVAAAVGGRIPVLMDGGVRRGTDVFKALALGADAVAVGRPYVWGLAAFGQRGVERALELLTEELERIMRLAGTPTVADIGPRSVTEMAIRPPRQ